MRKVLVTGGAGFIGTHLVGALRASGSHVVVCDPKEWDERFLRPHLHLRCRIRDIQIQDDYDMIFHLAADSNIGSTIDNPVSSLYDNIGDGTYLLDSAARSKIPVVISSSAAVYGNTSVMNHESDVSLGRARPISPYGLHKKFIEDESRIFYELKGLKSVNLRYFNVYGSGDSGSLITLWIQRALSKQPLLVNGDGEQSRDFVHVSDVVQANILAANALLLNTVPFLDGRAYNIGSGNPVTVNDVAKIFEENFKSLHFKYGPAVPGDIRYSSADIRRATEEICFLPAVELKKGIKELISWWEAQQNES